MLVDLNLKEKKVLVLIKDPAEAKRRMAQAREAGGVVRVGTRYDGSSSKKLIRSFSPFLTMISTGDRSLDRKIAGEARSSGSLVYVVDFPELNDLNMPAVAKLGDVRVGIYTGGKSPAMASLLRRRIEEEITKEDVLQVRLHGEIRANIKSKFKDFEPRKSAIYDLLADWKIKKLLKQGRYAEAKRVALSKIDERSK